MEAAHPPTSTFVSVSHSQSEDAPPTADMGWALKNTKESVHFITKVRQFLREVFPQGEDTGNKATAEDVAARMRSMRTAEGTKAFTQDEWLTSTQISRYFSRLAVLNRSGALHRTEEARPAPTEPVPDGGESEEEEEDPYVAEAPIIRTRSNQEGVRTVTLLSITVFICLIIFILNFLFGRFYKGQFTRA